MFKKGFILLIPCYYIYFFYIYFYAFRVTFHVLECHQKKLVGVVAYIPAAINFPVAGKLRLETPSKKTRNKHLLTETSLTSSVFNNSRRFLD